MPTVAITSYIAVSAPPGSKMRIDGTWSGVSSIQIVIWCHDDFGERQTVRIPDTGQPPIALNVDGTFSVTVDTLCGCGQDGKTVIRGYDASGVEVAKVEYPQLKVDCTPPDCCPDANQFDIAVDVAPDCTADCKRAATLELSYHGAAGLGCPPGAFMLVSVREAGSGGAVYTGPLTPVTLGVPTQFGPTSLPALAPGGYYVELSFIAGGQSCKPIVVPFEVEACDHPPPCPTGLALTAHDIGCSAGPNGDCLPTAQFVVSGSFGHGCGSQTETALLLDFGDGTPPASISMPAGSLQAVIDHQYATGGSKLTRVMVLSPSGCSPGIAAAQVKLQDCTAADCIDCPPPPTPPAWCLCKSCWLFSRKPGRKWCKAFMLVVIGLIALLSWAVLHGWVLGLKQPVWQLLAVLLTWFGSPVLLNYYSKYCGHCCAACAVWPGIILGIVLSLVSWVGFSNSPLPFPTYTVTVTWLLRLIAILILGYALYYYHNDECKKEEKNQLDPDDWCKPVA